MDSFSVVDLHYVGSTGGEDSLTEPIQSNQTNAESITESDETMTGSMTSQATSPQADEFDHLQQSEESTLRSRFPSTQGVRSNEANENEHSVSIRLILPNNSTLPVDVQLSTTLGEMRRLVKY